MSFTTPQFVLFLSIFLWIYSAITPRWRQVMLLSASYLFYASWSAPLTLLIMGSTLLDYWVARALNEITPRERREVSDGESDEAAEHDQHEHQRDEQIQRKRRRLLSLSLCFNLGALAFFKYCNFFIESSAMALESLGLSVSVPTLSIALPVGISFYTFQTLSYTVDVYRGAQKPARSLLDFALYVAYFPQLVAGPIERASRLLPQLQSLGDPTRRADLSGWGLIALGAFKKAVIADHFAALVDATYASPNETYALALWVGTYAFAIQIYCDFSGYSDIAIGVSRLLGVELTQNFRAPYSARGPSDFWRRWHISLSEWLRDYLYIPLGGGRDHWWRVRRNLMITMLLGGLWHGAAWHFIAWGGAHGLLLLIYRADWVRRLGMIARAQRFTALIAEMVARLFFFHLVCLTWVLFRAESLSESVLIMKRLVIFWRWEPQAWLQQVNASGEGAYLAWMMGVAATLVVTQNLWRIDSKQLIATLWRSPQWLRLTLVILTLYVTMLLAPERPPPFIYFQF